MVEQADRLRRAARDATDSAEDVAKAVKAAKKDGKPVDKKKLIKSLEGMNAEQIRAMRKSLDEEGIDLDDLLRGQPRRPGLKEAKVRLQGDPMLGDIMALKGHQGHEFSNGERGALDPRRCGGRVRGELRQNLGADKERLREILSKYDGEDLEKFAKQYKEETGQSLSDLVSKTLGEGEAEKMGLISHATPGEVKEQGEKDVKAAEQLAVADPDKPQRLDKNQCQIARDQIIEAVHGVHLDSTRAEKLKAALANKTPAECAYIRGLYKQETGHDLDQDLDKALSGGARALAKARLSGDPTRIAVATVEDAEDSGLTPWTVDDGKMKASMKELEDPAMRRAVDETYLRRNGESVTSMMDAKMTGRDRDIAKAYARGDTVAATELEVEEATKGGLMNGIHEGIAERAQRTFGIDTEAATRKLANFALGPLSSAAATRGADKLGSAASRSRTVRSTRSTPTSCSSCSRPRRIRAIARASRRSTRSAPGTISTTTCARASPARARTGASSAPTSR
ncbi:MAG: hypothetical protein IPQ07_30600 [Myxococcales bacterium]|nr:hypothetical protein [Myxococcales bacterium]